MNGLFKNLFIALICVSVLSCGKHEDTSTKVPESTNPDQTVTPAPSNTTPAATPTPTPDPRIPDFTGFAKVDLTDKVAYSGLEDVAQRGVVIPLVGDPKLVLHLQTGSNFAVSGDLLFGFEDKLGLEAIRVSTFASLATFQSNVLDAIFASETITFRVIGNSLSGAGSAYYRLADSNAKATYTFTNYYGQAATATGPYCVQFTCKDYSNKTVTCPSSLITSVTNTCKTYMDTADTNVKKLGTFSTTFSNWISLSQENK